MSTAYINRIATAVPPYDVHTAFLGFAEARLTDNPRMTTLFHRMAQRSGIEHRYSHLEPREDPVRGLIDRDGFYRLGQFPDTAARMRQFERFAPKLAIEAVERLLFDTADRDKISHLVITCCTGFSAPGLDLEIIERCQLPRTVERTIVGFMGCYAAMNALKVARHIVRSEPNARVLVLNLELCSLHFKETNDIEQILSFMIFADGCAASLVSAEPTGIALDSFHTVLAPETADLITWHIRESGFDMVLSGLVPSAVQTLLLSERDAILAGTPISAIDLWAIHPGGRSVLDAAERGLDLRPSALNHSREVLRRFGNMSSATIMFVLQAMLGVRQARGCGMAFGPGIVAETMLFHTGG